MKKSQIKVAEIKIGKSDKLYDYFCNDLKVQEGDFVYVENINFPVFVYDVKYKDKDETLANKSILNIVQINKHVKVFTKYEDVTKVECDCVVNSLGTKLDVFGSICKAIVTNAHSKEINDMIKNHPTAEIFDTFVTDAGDLKCKKVIHIVMPFKEDDRFNNLLKDAFCKVIDKALELGLKTIAIPKIGTGANGYSINDIYDALRDVTLKYQYTSGIELEIINLLFDTSISNVAKERRAAERQKVIKRIDSEAYFDKYDVVEATKIISNCSNINENDVPLDKVDEKLFKTDLLYIFKLISHKYNVKDEYFYIPKNVDENPFFFAWEYGKEKKLMHDMGAIYNKNMRDNFRRGNKTFRKTDCLRLAFLGKMNFTTIIQFMRYSGFSFSPNSKDDMDLDIFKYIYKYDGFTKGEEHFQKEIAKTCKNIQLILDSVINYVL